MHIQCPCGITLKVQDHLAGNKVRCPTCGEVFIARQPGEEKGSIQTHGKEQSTRSGNAESDGLQEQGPGRKKLKKPSSNWLEEDRVDEESPETPNYFKLIAGWVCCVLAGLSFLGGLSTVMFSGPGFADLSSGGVSYAVGAFLPFMVLLILSAWLLSKKKTRD